MRGARQDERAVVAHLPGPVHGKLVGYRVARRGGRDTYRACKERRVRRTVGQDEAARAAPVVERTPDVHRAGRGIESAPGGRDDHAHKKSDGDSRSGVVGQVIKINDWQLLASCDQGQRPVSVRSAWPDITFPEEGSRPVDDKLVFDLGPGTTSDIRRAQIDIGVVLTWRQSEACSPAIK